MKKQTLIAALGLILAVLTIVSTPATTLANTNKPLTFKLDFDFYVRDHKLDAGTYQIQQISDQLFVIRNVETKASVMIAALPQAGKAANVKTEKIVLHRYGQQVFLREIYNHRQSEGRLLIESKGERRAKAKISGSGEYLGQTNVKPEIIEVAIK